MDGSPKHDQFNLSDYIDPGKHARRSFGVGTGEIRKKKVFKTGAKGKLTAPERFIKQW